MSLLLLQKVTISYYKGDHNLSRNNKQKLVVQYGDSIVVHNNAKQSLSNYSMSKGKDVTANPGCGARNPTAKSIFWPINW